MAKYIELEVAVKAFNNFDAGRADSPPFTLLTPEEFAEYLYELPTADVAPVVHGRWIYDKKAQRPYCSVCKEYFYGATNSPMSYCSNCGAKMDGGADNDTN